MYAFCVLEMEINSNKVSIKKQQQAIQKVLSGQQQQHQHQRMNNISIDPTTLNPVTNDLSHSSHFTHNFTNQQQQESETIATNQLPSNTTQLTTPLPPANQTTEHNNNNKNHHQTTATSIQQQNLGHATNQLPAIRGTSHNNMSNHNQPLSPNGRRLSTASNYNTNRSDGSETSRDIGPEKTLTELQQEVSMSQTCYSDYQKTQVLTSSMLREVQRRFAKYYPDTAIPSRTTIKHVFEKCVEHGTVENMKKPRKILKIPQGDEIERMLIKEPRLSLRQLAQKLNVSTGTVSRRCKALGLVPESVTLKHQQLASARRQRRIRRLESMPSTGTGIAEDNANAMQSTSTIVEPGSSSIGQRSTSSSSSSSCLDCIDPRKASSTTKQAHQCTGVSVGH